MWQFEIKDTGMKSNTVGIVKYPAPCLYSVFAKIQDLVKAENRSLTVQKAEEKETPNAGTKSHQHSVPQFYQHKIRALKYEFF